MSAFGGKADMAFCGGPLSRSLLGVKRTSGIALHMSAYDPKRTCGEPLPELNCKLIRCLVLSLGGGNETVRFHKGHWRRSGDLASSGANTAGRAHKAHRRARSHSAE